MNVNDSEYEKLLANYRELQLRVTRFSSVEQELINTRDRLDDELVLYKKLNQFNKDALKDLSEKKFLQLVCEAIVDIFELESSVVFLNDLDSDYNSQLFTEGIKLSEKEKPVFIEDIKQIGKNFSREKSIILNSEFFTENKSFKNFSRGLLFLFSDSELKIDVYLFGLISKEYDPIYQQLKNRHETIFSVFSQQVQSMLANIRKNNRIHTQIKKISESESELRKLSQIATKTKNGVIISDELGQIVWVNEAFESITGYSFAEVRGKKPKEFLQGKDSDQQAILKLKNALQNKEYVEVTLVNYKKNGEKYFNALQITPVFDENGKHQSFIALQRDITSEILAKNKLLSVNSRFELITEKSQIGIWEWDLKSGKTSWNQVLLEQYGAENSAMEADFFNYWKTFLYPTESEKIKNKLDDFINSENEVMENEFKIIHGKTRETHILKSLIIAERDIHKNLLRVVGTTIDITGKKKFEKSILEKNEELKKINSELDNFVYSVSHDLRSPLLSVKGILSLIFKTSELDDKVKNYLKMAEKSILRLDGTIQEILEYSRNARLGLKLESFNLKEMVSAIYDDLKFSTTKQVVFNIEISCNEFIFSDKSRINTVLKNILGNAFKYLKQDNQKSVVTFYARKVNTDLLIIVSDNGEGIADNHLSKIFDMFYRASKSSSGTGLGLYICKEIITKLNGEIKIESKLNEGTTVYVSIPITE